MSGIRWGLSVVAMVGLLAATIAGATIWLIVTDPVTVSEAVAKGDVTPLVQAVGGLIMGAIRDLFKYL